MKLWSTRASRPTREDSDMPKVVDSVEELFPDVNTTKLRPEFLEKIFQTPAEKPIEEGALTEAATGGDAEAVTNGLPDPAATKASRAPPAI